MSQLIPPPHRLWLIVRTELRRSKRALSDNTAQVLSIAISGLFFLLIGFGAIVGAFVLGGMLKRGNGLPFDFAYIRGMATVVFSLPTIFVLMRTAQKQSLPSNPDGLLMAITHRDAVVGIVLAEMTKIIGIPMVFVLGIALAFAVGSGSPLSVLLISVSILLLAMLGAVLGFAFGLVILVLLATSAWIARLRTPILVVVFLAYIGVFFTGQWNSITGPLINILSATPLSWFADLALLGVNLSEVSVLQATGAVLIAVLGIPAGFGLCSWLAAQLWYITPVESTSGPSESRMDGGSIPFVSRMNQVRIRKTWLRALRSPIRLIFVIYPIFIMVQPVQQAVRTGTVPSSLPPLITLYGAWAIGAAFSLNPIGDEEPVLPITLTTAVRGRTFIWSLCLAGLVIGLPIVLAGSVLTGVLAQLGMRLLIANLLATVILCVGAPMIAAGPGTLFPRFEPYSVTRNRAAIVPSLFAFALFSIVFLIVSAPALIVLLFGTKAMSSTVLFGGIGLTLLLSAVASGLSIRYSINTFDEYYYEES